MKIKLLISVVSTLLMLFISISAISASNADSTKVSKGVLLSYWGNVSGDYGLQLGLEKCHLQTEKYKIIGTKSIVFQRKPDVYTSAGLILGSALRRTYSWGLYFEQGIKFGYLGSYYDFDFYKTKTDGTIVNIGRRWTSSIILGYSVGFGYDFAKKTKMDMQLFIKPNIYYRFPNNDNAFYLNNFSLEAGIILHPKWLK
jgi:hypothetical protein